MTFLLAAIIWSTAFVLWALGPIVSDAQDKAGRGVIALWRSPYFVTCAGVFLVFLGGGLMASLRWTDQVFGIAVPDPALLACYMMILIAAIFTLRPQSHKHPWRLRLHNAGLIALAVFYLVGD